MTYSATCHCGATSLAIPRLPEKATACTCTFCMKKGVLWGYFKPEEVTIETRDEDRVYEPSGINHHHFCGRCGCATWSLTPDWCAMGENDDEPPQRISVNLCLLDNANVRELPVELLDGQNAW